MKFLKKALIFMEEIIFPQCCLICGKVSKNIWCKECKNKIYKEAIFKEEISTRKQDTYFFNKHIYVFEYKNVIRNLILDYKFNDKSYLYKIFSEIITKNEKICGILKKYDIIIPVPIHKKRRKQRGYNQSELIAKEIAYNIKNLRYENSVLEKVKNVKPQSLLRKKQREQNVKNVYKIVKKEKIKDKKIILFDDIYTTGSTANECCKILKQNGAKEILVLTIAKD